MILYSVVIPTLGQLRNLRNLLNSLERLNGIDQAEILIIQNPPSRHIERLIHEFPHLQIKIGFSPAGVNHARNKGLQGAQGDYVFFLDDDCTIADRNFFEIHKQAHQHNAWAFAVGGFYRNTNPTPLAKAYGEIQREWLETNRLSLNGDCSTLLGGHFSIERQKSVDCRFDDNIRYGGSETEFFFRLHQQGFRFLLIELAIEHDPQMNIFSFIRKAHLQGKTHRRLLQNQLFLPASWLHSHSFQPNFYRKLYYRFFHQDYDLKIGSQLKNSLRKFLIRSHQSVCFYLSNKNHF